MELDNTRTDTCSSIGHVYRAPPSLDVICVESRLNIYNNDQYVCYTLLQSCPALLPTVLGMVGKGVPTNLGKKIKIRKIFFFLIPSHVDEN